MIIQKNTSALLFTKDAIPNILDGTVRATCRIGLRPFEEGEHVILCCPWSGFVVRATVEFVDHAHLQYFLENEEFRQMLGLDITDLLEQERYDAALEAIRSIGGKYAQVDGDTMMTLIAWGENEVLGVQAGTRISADYRTAAHDLASRVATHTAPTGGPS